MKLVSEAVAEVVNYKAVVDDTTVEEADVE